MKAVGWIGLCLVCSGFCFALDLNRDPSRDDYLFGQGLGCPIEYREKTFRADESRANFTFFRGVTDVSVQNGVLAFTLTGSEGKLGWGNYLGRQKLEEIQSLWQELSIIRMRVRQSRGSSNWTVKFWCDGRRDTASVSMSLSAGEWRDHEFSKALYNQGAIPDGAEFTVTGPKGARVELEWIKFVQPVLQGYFRYEFDLPEGPIWRAAADVSSKNERFWFSRHECISRLYINGQVVQRRGARHLYHAAPVDIARYLRPGRNCVGFYGSRLGTGPGHAPAIYLQSEIVMESGQRVAVATGTDWKYSPDAPPGWSEASFDDATWTKAMPGMSPALDLADHTDAVPVPTYQGVMEIRNPNRRDLFYRANEDATIDVHVPRGFESRRPSLEWALGRADEHGRCAAAAEGRTDEFHARDGSLVYALDLGAHPHGIYAIALALRDGQGRVIEERPREPIVVVRKQPARRIPGANYREGLDLELEDEIDFTDPGDSHPWIESEAAKRPVRMMATKVETPRVIRADELVYREVAGRRRGSSFSYRFEFQHPGSFYLLELDYPDNAKRITEVTILSSVEEVFSNSQSGVGAETGGRFLTTGGMATLRWIHVADPGPHSVAIINVRDGQHAAASSFRVYRINGDLPAAPMGSGRRYGIHTERCFYSSAIGTHFGLGYPKSRAQQQRELRDLPLMQRFLRDLVWMQRTCERYVQYLRFTGQNTHLMGCIQYDEYNSPFVPASRRPDSRIRYCMKTMLANQLDMNGIDFYAGAELSQSMDVRTYANNTDVARGADTVWMVDAQGRQIHGIRHTTVVPNWLRPEVREKYTDLLASMGETFGHLPHFRGVHGILCPSAPNGYYRPQLGVGNQYGAPPQRSFDDFSMLLFEKDTGVKLPFPRSDRQRFAKRAEALSESPLKDRFVEWRAEKLKEVLAEETEALRRSRDDLVYLNTFVLEPREFYQYLVESGRPLRSVTADLGTDLALLQAVPGLAIGRWAVSWRAELDAAQDPYMWIARTSPAVAAAFEHPRHRMVMIRSTWDENFVVGGGQVAQTRTDHDRLVASDWVMNARRTRAHPQPGGWNAREALIQALVVSDANIVWGAFTDLAMPAGHEQILREVIVPYTHLPPDRFEPVIDTGLDTDLTIRRLVKDGQGWFYVANPCQWPVRGTITLSAGADVCDLVTGERVARGGRDVRLPVELAPFGLAACRVASPQLAISAYRTEPLASEELERLQRVPRQVAELLVEPEVADALSPEDVTFMKDSLGRIQTAIRQRAYSRAWSLITHYRFWTLWQKMRGESA